MLALGTTLAVASCSESDNGTGVTGGFTISVSPTSVTIAAGGQGTVAVTVTRTGEFADAVSLSAQGLATGITASFIPSSVPGSSTSSTITVNVASTVAAGSYPFTVRATAGGQPEQTRQVTVVVTEAPGFSLSLSNGTLNITQGQNATTTVTVTTTTTFTGSVTLSVSGLPNGVTAGFSQNPVPIVVATEGVAAAVLPSVLTLTVGSGVTAGNYTLTVTGTAQGLVPVNSSLALTVTAAAVPGFTMGVDPNVLSVNRGTTGQVTVTIARTGGFTGPVTLSPAGQPLQATVAFSQNPATGNSVIVTFNVGAGTSLGAHTITIQGTATGVGTAQVTITLTVTAPPTGGSVTMQFCGIITPIWLAVQNGVGQWTQVQPGPNDTYQFTIDQFGGVAYVEIDGTNGYELTILYASGAEFAALGPTAFCPAATKTVTGMVAGLGATESATINLGGSLSTANSVNPNWTAMGVPPGLQDLLAVRSAFTLTPPFTTTPNAFVLQRGLNIPHQGSAGTVDFTGAPAPIMATVNIANGLGQMLNALTTYNTPNSSGLQIGGSGIPDAVTARTIYGLPTPQAGDLHGLLVSAINAPTSVRTHTSYFQTLTNQDVTLGDPLTNPAVTVASTIPHVQMRTVLPRQADYQSFWNVRYTQLDPTGDRATTIQMTAAYIGVAANFDAQIPSFLTVGGWNANYGLRAGIEVDFTVLATGWSVTSTLMPNPSAGLVIKSALFNGVISP